MVVLDSSALLCVLNGEAGAERMAQVLPSAVIGAANLAEVVTKLSERGLSVKEVEDVLGALNLERVSDLLCMSDPVHASGKGSMNDDLQGSSGRVAEGRRTP